MLLEFFVNFMTSTPPIELVIGCGLFGAMSSNLVTAEITRLKTLGLVSSLRGIHSTGIATAYRPKTDTGSTYKYWSDAVQSAVFLEHANFKKMTDETGLQLVLGHARHATLGAVNKENAHPFYVEPLIGCHNGTMPSFSPPHSLRDSETDSLRFYRQLAETLNQGGTFLDVRNEYMKDGDAYALTWINTKDNTLNIVRNEARTLYMMLTKTVTATVGTMYYASEPCFLRLMDARAPVEHQSPVYFEPNKVYTFDIGNVASMRAEALPEKPRVHRLSSLFRGHSTSEEKDIASVKSTCTDVIPFERPPSKTTLVVRDGEIVPKEDTITKKPSNFAKTVSSIGIETHSAVSFYDGHIPKHQVLPRIYTKKGVEYILKYRGWKGELYALGEIKQILSLHKSIVSQKKGTLNEALIWLDEDCFIKPEELQDSFVNHSFNSRFRGELVYVKKDEFAKHVSNKSK